nr:E-beta-farnesene synthase [Tanacetum cinerariifolium]
MADVNVNALSEQAPAMAPPTRTDDQILPHSRWVPVGKSNCYLDVENSQINPVYTITVDILKHTNFFRAFPASSTIPSIYIQQFWDTVRYDRDTARYIYKKNLALHTQGKKKANPIVIPSIRFTNLIIHHLQSKHKFNLRPDSPLHLPYEEYILGYLKFSAKGTKREVFGMSIPNELITTDIQGEQYYKEYLDKVAKPQRYLVGEEGSDPDSPAPKPAKSTKKSKPSAPKAAPVTKPADAQQPKPKPAPAKSQKKKCKLVTETSDKPSLAKSSKPGAMEESLKSVYDAHRGPLLPVVIREPDSGKFQPLPEVQKNCKEKRRTPAPTKASGHAESHSIYEELGLIDSNTGSDEEGLLWSELELKMKVILEEPASSIGTLSSLQHLAKDFSFGNLFFNDKSSEAENEKTTTETEAESMVPDSPNVHRPLQATATETTTTTTTTHPPPPQPQQSTTDSMLIKRIALEKSMNCDHTDELLKDLVEARRKKKRRHDSLKTPHGSPPHQPPPPPPPAGPSRTSGSPGASGSSQVPPPPPPPPSTNQKGQSHGSTAPSFSKTAASAEYTTWTTTNTRLRPFVSSIPEDLHMDDDMAPDEQVHSSDDEDIGNAHISKVNLQQDWWKPLEEDRPATPEPAWYNISKPLPLGGPPGQMWIEKECKYDIAAMYGISHWWFQRQRFYIDRHTSEGDLRVVRTHMRILSVVRIEFFSMYGYDYMKKIVLRRADLNKHIIAKRDFKYLYPKDFQPGIESYQTQLNLTKPRWDATGFEYKNDFTIIDSSRVVTFRDKYEVQMIMRFNEIHKFSDDTLHQIDEALDYRVNEFKVNMMNPRLNTRFWTRKDMDRSKEFMFAIQKWLKTRRIFRNLESFVGGRVREGDYRLLQRTK